MLNFELTEDHRLLEQSVREWAGARRGARASASSIARTASIPAILPQMASLGLLGISVPVEYGGAGMDYIALGLASEELEYVDTSLRVIMSVHAGLNCLTLLSWGTEDQKQRYLVPQAQGAQDCHLRADRTVGRQRRTRHSDRGGQEGRSLRADRREDVDLAGRRRRQLPGVRLERSREEEAARPVGHERLHRRTIVQGVLERHAQGEVGHPRGQHRVSSRWTTSRCRPRTWSGARAKASRSRCSRSTRGATPWRPARPV